MFGTEIGDDCLNALSKSSNLECLDIGETNVSDDGLKELAGLRNLRRLSLWGADIGDGGLVHLTELTSLKRIDVRETNVTAASVKLFSSALPKCEVWR